MQIQSILNHDNVVVTSIAVAIICEQLKSYFGHVPPMVRVKHDHTAGKMHLLWKPADRLTEEDVVLQETDGFKILWNPEKDSALAGTHVDADSSGRKLVIVYP